MTNGWNYADVWEEIADRFPDEPALIHGDHRVSWSEFAQRADAVAAALVDAGLGQQAKVAQYNRNSPAYLETLFASFKAALVPVNTNFRYSDDELTYLWSNSETEAVVFDAEFTSTCDRIRIELPQVKLWLRVGDETSECPDWARDYETVCGSPAEQMSPPWGRSGDDIYMLYTGGTTGMPKGVMWPQDDLFRMLEAGSSKDWSQGPADPVGWADRLKVPHAPVALPAPPLMHGTASWFCLVALNRAGSIVTLTKPSLDAIEMLDTAVRQNVQRICIVGDAFATPMINAIEDNPDRWNLEQLRVIMSSGAMLSEHSKKRLLHFAPRALILDGLGSSESGSLGTSIAEDSESAATARFQLTGNTRVLDEDLNDVVPGSGQAGRLAVGGYLPLGYFKDEEKTAATFVEVDGRRYVIAGDWAEVEADGAIRLLGRGSSCINTAGEKVYPEEVEDVLKEAAGVLDAAVVGVSDDRFGQRVVALVEGDTAAALDEQTLIDHVKSRLASYKAPRTVVLVDSINRGANGKLDQKYLRSVAIERTSEQGAP